MFDFPTAVGVAPSTLRAYLRGQSGAIWEFTQSGGGAWSAASIGTGSPATLFLGAPSASLAGGVIYVHARTTAGTLGTLQLAGSWSFTNNGGGVTGSPTSTAGQAHIRGTDAALYLFNGSLFVARGGLFD